MVIWKATHDLRTFDTLRAKKIKTNLETKQNIEKNLPSSLMKKFVLVNHPNNAVQRRETKLHVLGNWATEKKQKALLMRKHALTH